MIRQECIQQLQDEVQNLIDKVSVLEAGACRFNCRTARQNWTAGFNEACSNNNYRVCDADEVYDEWKRRHHQAP